MRKIFLVLSLCIFFHYAHSQFIPVPSWGIRGGFNFADIGGNETDNAMKAAVNLGLYGQKHFNAFWQMRVELLLSGEGHGAKTDFDNKLNLVYLNLPLLVEYDPSFNFGFLAGLQPGLMLSGKSRFNDESFDVKDQFKAIDLGLVLGASYYLLDKKVALGLRYIHGFTNISEDVVQTRYSRVIQVSASYMIARLFEE